MKNAGLHGRGGGGVQREKVETSRAGAEEAVWVWDRPQLTRGHSREQRGGESQMQGSHSQRKSWGYVDQRESPGGGSNQVACGAGSGGESSTQLFRR